MVTSIWLGIFKGFPILLFFFSLHIQYSWLLSGRKCGRWERCRELRETGKEKAGGLFSPF